ncbi:MAG: preprotein translocase subunit SecG [Prevotellaceae bacterium]|nr:preprotein translocase subunit SecG [Prevotellaceae bacterium]
MYTLFVILIVLAALLMIGIVLIQESKGGGLASNFSSSNQIMGVRKTTDFIEKATWGLAIAMVVLSVICAYVAPKATDSESVIEKAATEQPQTNPNNLPGFGASQTKEAAPATNAKSAGDAKQATPSKEAKPVEAPKTPQN